MEQNKEKDIDFEPINFFDAQTEAIAAKTYLDSINLSGSEQITVYQKYQKDQATIDFLNNLSTYIPELKDWLKELEKAFQGWSDALGLSMIDESGDYESLTEYQKVMINYLPTLLINLDLSDDKYNNKTIDEIIKMLEKESKNKDIPYELKTLKNLGFGKFILEDVYRDEVSGYDGVMLRDVNGDYVMLNDCTSSSQMQDILFDAYKISQKSLPSSFLRLYNTLRYSNLIGDMSKTFKSPDEYYNSQISAGKKFFNKYYNEAYAWSKKIHIGGYSLGGAIAEEIYLEAKAAEMNKRPFFGASIMNKSLSLETNITPSYSNVLGELLLFNSYHANLSDTNISFLKKYGDLDVYASDGDMVSTIYNYEDFKDITKIVYTDSSSIFQTLKEERPTDGIPNFSDMIISGLNNKNIKTLTTKLGISLSDETIKSLDNIGYIFDENGSHSYGHIKQFAFNDDGSLKTRVVTDTGIEQVKGKSFKESSEELYGYDVKLKLETELAKIDGLARDLNELVDVVDEDLSKAQGNEGLLKQPGAVSRITSKVNDIMDKYDYTQTEKNALFDFVVQYAEENAGIKGVKSKILEDSLKQDLDTMGVVASAIKNYTVNTVDDITSIGELLSKEIERR